jgi:hypothetical protein
MTTTTTIIVLICYLAAIIPHQSFSLQQIRKQQQRIQKSKRTTKKTHDKFVNWADTANTYDNRDRDSEQKKEDELPLKLLVIDGNNVRGIGKFELDPLELQHHVVRFCYKYRIPNVMIVWDHGSDKFACTRNYECDSNNNNSNNNNNNNNNFIVNIIILFSGLRQRADDVIVAESKHLISLLSSSMDWSSMAFVTNDRELNYKLRRQSTTTSTTGSNNEPSTIRFSRRKRAKGFAVADTKRLLASDNDDNNDNGNDNDNVFYHNRNVTNDTIEANKYSDTSNSNSNTINNKKEGPMFCDSTGFVKLLEELPEYNIVVDSYDQITLKSLKETKESIVRFIKSSNQQQSRGGGGGGYKLNPRREKTWERCIQAEIFRRSLILQQQQQLSSSSEEKEQDSNNIFTKYLEELQLVRGYHNHLHSNLTPSPVDGIDDDDDDGIDNDNDNDDSTFQPFQGPSRLDKRERRLLDRYNSLLKKGEIP